MRPVQEFDNRDIPFWIFGRAMRRRNVFGLAVLAALGLSANDAGTQLVDAAQKEASTEAAHGSGRQCSA